MEELKNNSVVEEDTEGTVVVITDEEGNEYNYASYVSILLYYIARMYRTLLDYKFSCPDNPAALYQCQDGSYGH